MDDMELVQLARQAMTYSYSPYSHCKVGAALLTQEGKVFTGCNIENAAYGPTNCAERTAIFKAVSEGYRTFLAIAIAGGVHGQVTKPFPPCGVCRQVMREFCDNSFRILLADREEFVVRTLGELLPDSFLPADISMK